MRQNYRAQRLNAGRADLRRPIPAIAALAMAFVLAISFAHSALAQSTPAPAAPVAAPNPQSAPSAMPSTMAPAPAVQTPAPTAPSAALPEPPPGEPIISNAQLPQDLSPWGMFQDADTLVKIVLVGLAFASLVTWTVWVAKTIELRAARREVRKNLRVLNAAATFAQAHEQLRDGVSPVSLLMQAAGQEIRLSANLRAEGLKERIAWQLERIEMAVSRKISRGTGVLATIGSTAPFVGLFGTVWGIMNSFIGISNSHTTNLAVVAPGIAQALLATALGLVAAIPAVMIYNVLARQTMHYRALLGDASAQVMRLVSRDLDRARMPLTQAAAE
ncbi:MAG: tonB-system energizer ExbB [Xanthobacteraceae bacterium]|jgi:biopolymer transport protein ExbB